MTAQGTYSEETLLRADGLRATLHCPTNVEWPDLPQAGRPVFRTEAISQAGDTIYAVPDSALWERPDITIPQYAFFFNPTKRICEPVVLLQAEGKWFGYTQVGGHRSGAAEDVYFEPLGTAPPEAPDLTPSAGI